VLPIRLWIASAYQRCNDPTALAVVANSYLIQLSMREMPDNLREWSLYQW
jgi:hypothetical protein